MMYQISRSINELVRYCLGRVRLNRAFRPRLRPNLRIMAGLMFSLLSVTGCVQRMTYQPKYLPLTESAFFKDGLSSRPLVPGTVARGQLHTNQLLYAGTLDGKIADTFPFPVTQAVLDRGQQRFNIYCAPCHGRTGYGDGMIVQRGYPAPPSFHIDRLRQVPVGYIFQVATNGLGQMPSYAAQVPPEDRWAIVAYIRALQLSQHATPNDVPADVRQQLEAKP